jgi:SAM-dependent methyltransferase
MPFISTWLKPATDLMLDLAKIGTGSRVLDLAAGDGDQSFMAAQRVGPTGYVLSTDIAENFVTFAAHTAEEAGLHQMEARVMDSEQLDVVDASLDAVISRLGIMYFPNPQQALGEAWRVLKHGGRIAVIVFSTSVRNPFFSIPDSIIRKHTGLAPPPPERPGPFRFGEPELLKQAVHDAGFARVESQVLAAPVRMASAAECLRWRRETSGTLQQMLRGLSDTESQQAWEEIETELEKYEGTEGFESPCELIVGAGLKE